MVKPSHEGSTARVRSRRGPRRRPGGFSLLEVLIAVAILSISMTSLLSSQMASFRATRYAKGVTAASFLAEYQLVEMEFRMRRDGWPSQDRKFDGTFSDQGWPDVRYDCIAKFMKMPEYSALKKAAEDGDGTDGGRDKDMVYDAGEQAFGALGMVWQIVKAAIEQSIRKATCTVKWKDGASEHELVVSTYWTDPTKLDKLALGDENNPPPGP